MDGAAREDCARMIPSRCYWPKCKAPARPLVCAAHWSKLPKPMQDELVLAARGGLESSDYILAAKHAREWIWSNAE